MGKSRKSCIRYLKRFVQAHRHKIRRFWAWSAVIVLVGIGSYTFGWELYKLIPTFKGIPTKPFNELTKASIDVRLEQAGNMYQIGVAILVALWGLLFVRKEEVVLVFDDLPELTMCVCATILLLLSILSHHMYVNKVIDSYTSARDTAVYEEKQEAKQKAVEEKEYEVRRKAVSTEKNVAIRQQKRQDMLFERMVKNSALKEKKDVDMPDIFHPAINYLFVAQQAFLITGIINALLTFVSAHKLKPATKQKN